MCQVRFIGCLHLGHEALARYRGFQESSYHDEYLIAQWNRVVAKRDLTYILGDLTMETSRHYHMLDQLNGTKKVVLGNHDRLQDVPELLQHVAGVSGAVNYKGFLLTHVPIHPNEMSFCRGNIHAHIHHVNKLEEVVVSDSYKDKDNKQVPTLHKYYNVDAKLLDFKPVLIENLKTL